MQLQVEYTVREARTLLAWLIGIELTFVALYLMMHLIAPGVRWGPPRVMFDLAEELSFPTWFSSVQLLVVGVILLLVSRDNESHRHVPTPALFVAGVLFVFLSADEAVSVHEQITGLAGRLNLGWLLIRGHGAWMPVYLILGLAFLLLFTRYFVPVWRYHRRESLVIGWGWALFLAGAVGLELISYFGLRYAKESVAYKLEVAGEEFLEMSGVSVILYGILLLVGGMADSTRGEHWGQRAKRRDRPSPEATRVTGHPEAPTAGGARV